MSAPNRTEYSMRNATVAMVTKIAAILFGFAARVVFTRLFSQDYVSLNGLLTNLLSALNMGELGVGTALVYAMYGPAARGDREKQKSLMLLYGKLYRVIALVVLGIGAVMYPIVLVLIGRPLEVDHLLLIYILFVANALSSYFLAYKGMMFLVMQENYVNELLAAGFLILQNVLQILVLVWTRNYILFLLLYVVCSLLRNICTSVWAENRYPFLMEKSVRPMDPGERREIYRNVRAMLMHKIGLVGINNTDNLILTGLVGFAAVGVYSNYYLVIGSIRQIIDKTVQGIVGSVGNLGASAEKPQVGKIFRATCFTVNWIYGFAAICMVELLDLFMEVFFGPEYVFAPSVTLVLCLNFYLNGLRQAVLIFRDALGLFWYDRYKTVVEALVNLTVSIVLARAFGTIGVFIGTTVSIVSVALWAEPLVLYRRYFSQPLSRYFLTYGRNMLAVLAAGAVTWAACGSIPGSPGTQLLLRAGICLILPNAVILLLLHRTREFRLVWEKGLRLLRTRRERRRPAREKTPPDGSTAVSGPEAPALLLREAAGSYWLVDTGQKGPQYRPPVQMNESGAALWRLLTSGKSPEEAARELARQEGVPPEEVMEDVRAFLDVMGERIQSALPNQG